MRFYCRFLSVLLLLVSLTRATQGSGLRTRRSVWNEIGNTLNNVGEKIKDTIKTKIEPLFHRHSIIGPDTTTPTLEPEPDYETSPFYRGIITAPIRCPPNHGMVRGRCRLITRRR
ncbi:hypothetical protein ACFW04_010494 [Cataglyphis niger]